MPNQEAELQRSAEKLRNISSDHKHLSSPIRPERSRSAISTPGTGEVNKPVDVDFSEIVQNEDETPLTPSKKRSTPGTSPVKGKQLTKRQQAALEKKLAKEAKKLEKTKKAEELKAAKESEKLRKAEEARKFNEAKKLTKEQNQITGKEVKEVRNKAERQRENNGDKSNEKTLSTNVKGSDESDIDTHASNDRSKTLSDSKYLSIGDTRPAVFLEDSQESSDLSQDIQGSLPVKDPLKLQMPKSVENIRKQIATEENDSGYNSERSGSPDPDRESRIVNGSKQQPIKDIEVRETEEASVAANRAPAPSRTENSVDQEVPVTNNATESQLVGQEAKSQDTLIFSTSSVIGLSSLAKFATDDLPDVREARNGTMPQPKPASKLAPVRASVKTPAKQKADDSEDSDSDSEDDDSDDDEQFSEFKRASGSPKKKANTGFKSLIKDAAIFLRGGR